MIDDVDLLLREAGVPGPVVGPEEVDRLAGCVVADGLRDELVCAVLETCDGVWDGVGDDGAPLTPDALGMRIDGWRLDLGRTTARTGLTGAVLAGALVQQGLTEMVIGVVAAVLPSVLDVERARLTAAERRLVLELRLHPDVRAGAMSEDALYERLPDAVREVVNRLEFADFTSRLRDVGGAGSDAATITVDDPDGPPIRFSWR